MDVSDFNFELPDRLIAQEAAPRGTSRLLVLDRSTGALQHSSIAALPSFFRAGDLLVVNNTRVFAARLLGRRVPSGGAVECLLVRRLSESAPQPIQAGVEFWGALVHPGQKLKPGSRVVFEGIRSVHGEILDRHYFGRRVLRLWTQDGSAVDEAVDAIGHVPLPPYIRRADRTDDRERYQTVFAD